MPQSDLVAPAVEPDMVEAGWEPTAETYLNRVHKVRIFEAVREAKGEETAQLLDHLNKGEMATGTQRLLKGSDRLSEFFAVTIGQHSKERKGRGRLHPFTTPIRREKKTGPPPSCRTCRATSH